MVSMRYFAAITAGLVLTVSLVAAQQYPDVAEWGNCGGLSTHPCAEDRACAKCSSSSYTCVSGGKGEDNPYYWQCIPKSSAKLAGTSAPPAATVVVVSGCTDPEADNYDIDATDDDGSCEISGCTDILAQNYVRAATRDDGSCVKRGCTNPEADNYQPNANTDDGSCEFTVVTPPVIATPAATAGGAGGVAAAEQAITDPAVAEASLPADDTVPASEYEPVAAWEACGGISNHVCAEDRACATCLPDEWGTPFECKKGNKWYWQCQKADGASTPQAADQVADQQASQPAAAAAVETPASSVELEQSIPADSEGIGKTTRYFDGCKASCAWAGNVGPTVNGPVQSCSNEFDENGIQIRNTDPNLKSVCGGGGTDPEDGGSVAYECLDRNPFRDDGGSGSGGGLRFGFAASNSRCCECYELTFLATSVDNNGQICSTCSSYRGGLAGEKIIIQVTNEGGDLGPKQFDLQITAGGLGLFNGVAGPDAPNGPTLFGGDESAWGERYGGVQTREQCFDLPAAAQEYCLVRFDDLKGADNPGVSFKRVKCGLYPQLYQKSGCLLKEDQV